VTLGIGPHSSWQNIAAILGGCAVLSVTIFCGYAIIFSTPPMVALYRRGRRWIESLLSLFFAFAGLRMLLSRI
jgi:threonine efflux protein